MIDNCFVAMTHDESSPQDVSRNFAIPAASDNLIAPCIWFQHYDKNNSKNMDYLQLSFILSACKQTKLYPSNVTGLSPSCNDMPPLRFLLTKGRLKPLHFKSQTLLGNSRVGACAQQLLMEMQSIAKVAWYIKGRIVAELESGSPNTTASAVSIWRFFPTTGFVLTIPDVGVLTR